MRRLLLVCLVFPLLASVALGKQVLRIALEAEPTSLDPHQITDYNSIRAAMPMFETLPQFAPGTTEIVPGLAQSWEVSEDGLVYTFYLRKGVNFHDGTPLTAEAVKFNVDRQIDPNHPYHSTGVFAYAEFTFGMVDSVTVLDDFVVQFKLKHPFAPFLRNMAMASAAIISPEAIKRYQADIAINPVGTGPFKFKEWTPGVRIVLERNDNYWGERALLDELVFRPIVNPQSRLAALEAGEVDFIVNPPPEDVARLRENPNLQVVTELGQHTWWIALNCQRPPFNNVLVRQAVHHAIDKNAIVEGILRNTGIVATNPLPPNVWSYTEEVKVYEYNPTLAKQLLAQAGYPNGFTVDFWVPESGSGMQQPIEMATAIQAYLAQVGITARIQTWEWGTYLDKVFQPDYTEVAEMHEMSWIMDNGDPDNFLYILFSSSQWPPAGFNESFYKNERV
ncbi:MAG: ABC transporter substrate-binding protein, partial [Candidatus Bipolaricaulota bacterium]|nr:ABC transporter substrate-binding protein [Candidatus Bipolaricaulota bacterium]MDW8127210.1 ABC transporter substrate-binding protein [Candidatus Bipolaricaulota bacterium]